MKSPTINPYEEADDEAIFASTTAESPECFCEDSQDQQGPILDARCPQHGTALLKPYICEIGNERFATRKELFDHRCAAAEPLP